MGLWGSGIDCDSIEIHLNQVVDCLENYIELSAGVRNPGDLERDAVEAIRGLRAVMAYRGNVLFIQRRVKKFGGGYHLSIKS